MSISINTRKSSILSYNEQSTSRILLRWNWMSSESEFYRGLRIRSRVRSTVKLRWIWTRWRCMISNLWLGIRRNRNHWETWNKNRRTRKLWMRFDILSEMGSLMSRGSKLIMSIRRILLKMLMSRWQSKTRNSWMTWLKTCNSLIRRGRGQATLMIRCSQGICWSEFIKCFIKMRQFRSRP